MSTKYSAITQPQWLWVPACAGTTGSTLNSCFPSSSAPHRCRPRGGGDPYAAACQVSSSVRSSGNTHTPHRIKSGGDAHAPHRRRVRSPLLHRCRPRGGGDPYAAACQVSSSVRSSGTTHTPHPFTSRGRAHALHRRRVRSSLLHRRRPRGGGDPYAAACQVSSSVRSGGNTHTPHRIKS